MESLESLLGEANRRAASEVLLMAGDAPSRLSPGPWMRLPAARCTPAEVEAVVTDILSVEEWAALEQRREIEVEKIVEPLGRVHCDIHFQRGSLVVVMRKLGTRDV